MNIVQITAGTGNFYCGTCLRDHSLVKALNQLGHHCILFPMYLPLQTDSTDYINTTLHMGGINFYLGHTLPFYDKLPSWFHKFMDHPYFLTLAGKFRHFTKAKDLGELTYAMAGNFSPYHQKSIDQLKTSIQSTIKPDIIILSNVLLNGLAKSLKETFNCKILCTLQGEDSFIESLPKEYQEKSWNAINENTAYVDQYIVVSQYHQQAMSKYMPKLSDKSTVVYNATDYQSRQYDKNPNTITLGYCARLSYPKGLHTFVDMFIELCKQKPNLELKCHIAGIMLEEDKPFVEQQKQKLKGANLYGKVTISPNITKAEKDTFYKNINLLSVPANYSESFGLYLVEAWAHGIPTVQPNSAAFKEITEHSHAGILYAADDQEDYLKQVVKLISEPELYSRLSQNGVKAVKEVFNPEKMGLNIIKSISKA